MAERQIEGYLENGDSGSGGEFPPELMRVFKILSRKTDGEDSSSRIERIIVAFDVAAKHCATKTQKPELL